MNVSILFLYFVFCNMFVFDVPCVCVCEISSQSASANGRYPEITLFPVIVSWPKYTHFTTLYIECDFHRLPEIYFHQHCTSINQNVEMIRFNIIRIQVKSLRYVMMMVLYRDALHGRHLGKIMSSSVWVAKSVYEWYLF